MLNEDRLCLIINMLLFNYISFLFRTGKFYIFPVILYLIAYLLKKSSQLAFATITSNILRIFFTFICEFIHISKKNAPLP